MRKDITTIIVGLLFLAAGVAIGGSMLGLFEFTVNFNGWWTLFLIVPALLSIIQGGFNTGNSILLCIGAILLLQAQGVLPPGFSWRLIFPVVLLIVGFQLLFGNRNGYHHNSGRQSRNSGEPSGSTGNGHRSSSHKNASAIFGGQDIIYGNEEFSGGSWSAIFGGCTVNLKNVTITGEAIISVTALFGGITLILPDNVQVQSNVMPLLGGADCKYTSSRDPLAPKIIINGTASFGGVEIR